MSSANRVIKNTGILYARMGITMFISLYTTRLILNALGADDFGIFSVVAGVIAMLGFLNASMTGATQRFISYAEGQGDTEKKKYIFNASIILHLFTAILAGFLLWGAGYLFFDYILNIPESKITAAKTVYLCAIASTIFTILTVPYDAVLNAHENMFYYAGVGIVESILKLIAAFIVIKTSSDKLIIYGVLMSGISLSVMIIMRVYCRRNYIECRFSPFRYFRMNVMKEIAAFSGWNFISLASNMLAEYSQPLILNHFYGTLLNTAQSIAAQISGQLMAFSNTMMKALNPLIVKSEGAGDREAMLLCSLRGGKFSYLLLAMFAIPFAIEAPIILKFWLGHIPEWTITFCRLQLLRSLLEQFITCLALALSASGAIRQYSYYRLPLNLGYVALTYVFFTWGLPPYWLYISAIIFSFFLGGALVVYFCHIKTGLSIKKYIQYLIYPCIKVTPICFLLDILIHNIFNEPTITIAAIRISLMIFIFAILAWIITLDKDEKSFSKTILKSFYLKLRSSFS